MFRFILSLQHRQSVFRRIDSLEIRTGNIQRDSLPWKLTLFSLQQLSCFEVGLTPAPEWLIIQTVSTTLYVSSAGYDRPDDNFEGLRPCTKQYCIASRRQTSENVPRLSFICLNEIMLTRFISAPTINPMLHR